MTNNRKRAGWRSLLGIGLGLAAWAGTALAGPYYPPSDLIETIRIDMSTKKNIAPGNGVKAPESDNWTITWADDGHQYTSWGDGQGFRTMNRTRASLGVSRIEGGKDNYSAYDIFKTGHDAGGWGGKSLGIVSVDGVLYLLRNGTGSTGGAFEQTELWKSTDHGRSWSYAGVRWKFNGMPAFYSPTFLQFGKDYQGARDNYVYIYANEAQKNDWNVQKPGGISLIRVPRDRMEDPSAYEYFSGFNGNTPTWSGNLADRVPVFQDPVNGNMRTSVSYNPGLKRYILITQQVDRFANRNYHIGIYEAPEPWGPWKTVLFDNPKNVGPGLNTGPKTVYWNFSNKWLSADGRHFVLVYTGPGPDEWGTVEGDFILKSNDTTPPSVPGNLRVTARTDTTVTLAWDAARDAESGVLRYRIYRDGALKATVSGTRYQDSGLAPGRTYQYQVSAVNGVDLESARSATLATATMSDTRPPALTAAEASDETTVVLTFSEAVDPTTAGDPTSYTISDGIRVTAAAVSDNQVTLTTTPMSDGATYRVTATGIRDRAPTPNTLQSAGLDFTFTRVLRLSELFVASGRPYAWGTADPGNLVYIDRNYSFTQVPGAYPTMHLLRTANDDKRRTTEPLIRFRANQDIDVHVAHVNTTGLPSWLSTWEATGDVIETTDRPLHVYRRRFPAGLVELGDNGGAPSMYVVLIAPASGSGGNGSTNAGTPAGDAGASTGGASENTGAGTSPGAGGNASGGTGGSTNAGTPAGDAGASTGGAPENTGAGTSPGAGGNASGGTGGSTNAGTPAGDAGASTGGAPENTGAGTSPGAGGNASGGTGGSTNAGAPAGDAGASTGGIPENTGAGTSPGVGGNTSGGTGGSTNAGASAGSSGAEAGIRDSDGDGLTDTMELQVYRTRPDAADTDGDGESDGEEIRYGSDPLDPSSRWKPHRPTRPALDMPVAPVAPSQALLRPASNFQDPDGDPLLAVEWQVAMDTGFQNLVLSRKLSKDDTLRIPVGVLESGRDYWARFRYLDARGLPSEWSPTRKLSVAQDPNDQDGDGVDDRYQIRGADTDGNGVPDEQEGMCNLSDAVQGNVIGFRPSSGRIRCLTAVSPQALQAAQTASTAPSGFVHGMFTFGVDNLASTPDKPAEVVLEIYFPDPLPAGTRWEKYDEVTGERRPFEGRVEIQGRRVLLHLVDGGPDDADGIVNGKIVDPSGPVLPAGGDTDTATASTQGGGGAFGWLLLLALPGLARRLRPAAA